MGHFQDNSASNLPTDLLSTLQQTYKTGGGGIPRAKLSHISFLTKDDMERRGSL